MTSDPTSPAAESAARLRRLLRASARLDRLRAELPGLLADERRETADLWRLAPLMPAWFRALFDGTLGERLRVEQEEANEAFARLRMAQQAVVGLASEREALLEEAEALARVPGDGTADLVGTWVRLERASDRLATAADLARGLQERADRVTNAVTAARSKEGQRSAKQHTLDLSGQLPALRAANDDAERALAAVGFVLAPIEPPIPEDHPSGRYLDVGLEVYRSATAVAQRLAAVREPVLRAREAALASVRERLDAGADADPGPLDAAEGCLRVAEAAEALAGEYPTPEALWALESLAEAARTAAVTEGRDPGPSPLYGPGDTSVERRLRALAKAHRRAADELVRLSAGASG